MDKIQQFIVAQNMEFFAPIYEKYYGLKCVNGGGYDPTQPCLFAGCYSGPDLTRITAHTGKRALVWMGSDTMSLNWMEYVRPMDDLVHIAISEWIYGRLYRMGLEPRRINLITCDVEFWRDPQPLGDIVYCYAPNESYGLTMSQRILEETGYQHVIIDNPKALNRKQLKEMYAKCFLGLRLRTWDGNSATVQELGLMGRRTVWNGGTPSAIAWKGYDDVKKSVTKEFKNRDSKNCAKMSELVYNSLHFGTDWLEI